MNVNTDALSRNPSNNPASQYCYSETSSGKKQKQSNKARRKKPKYGIYITEDIKSD